MNPKWLRAAPLAVMLLLSVALAFGLLNAKSPLELNQRLVGFAAGPFYIPALNGGHFSPATWQGKVAVLNVFASWCIPCAAEHEVVMKIAQSKKAAVYGLAWRDKPEKIAQWIASHGNPYQSIGIDGEGKSTVALALTGVPETFVFDKNGIIAYHYSGPLTDDMAEKIILPLLETLNAK